MEQASEYVTFQTKQIDELKNEIVHLKSFMEEELKKKTQGMYIVCM